MDTFYKVMYDLTQEKLLKAITALAKISGSYDTKITKKDLQEIAYKVLDEIVWNPPEKAK